LVWHRPITQCSSPRYKRGRRAHSVLLRTSKGGVTL